MSQDLVPSTAESTADAAAEAVPHQGPAVSAGETLAQLIAREMNRQELTLDMVARRSGLAIATVAALRSGTRGKRPRPATVRRLATGLGVSAEVVGAAAGQVQPATDAAREADLLRLFRQLSPGDQILAERVLREIARARPGLERAGSGD